MPAYSSGLPSGALLVQYTANRDTGTGWQDTNDTLGSALRLDAGTPGFFDPNTSENVWFDFSGSSYYVNEGSLAPKQTGGNASFGAGQVDIHVFGDYEVEVTVVSRKSGGAATYDVWWGVGKNGNNPGSDPDNVLASSCHSGTDWATCTGKTLLKSLNQGDSLKLYVTQIADGAATLEDIRVAMVKWTVRNVS